MSDDDEQLRVRVAWLYFMEGLTQADIAGKLGITRLRANRLLGEARASGLVNIQVNARLAGLRRAGAAAGPGDRPEGCRGRADPDRSRPDRAVARAAPRPTTWRGISARPACAGSASAGAPPCARPSAICARGNFPELSINSMMGGLTQGSSSTPSRSPANSRAASTASATTWPRRSMPAARGRATPSSPRTCSSETFQRLATNDVALLSVGDLSRRSLLIRYGLPRDVTVEFAARRRRRRRHHGHLPRCARASR